ncbi:MAG: hypothetical protein JXB03_09975, partial [Spirochaetales bacterium]|nr:hypothetical protein [Spirochaetales bacterium]
KTGSIADLPSFEAYLRGIVHQTLTFDLPYIGGIIHGILDGEEPDGKAAAEYDAALYNPDVRKAQIALGRGWQRLMPVLFSEPVSAGTQGLLSRWGIEPLFLAVMACSWGLDSAEQHPRPSLHEVIMDSGALWQYTTVRDQIGAAVRLGVIGPSKGVELTRKALEYAGQCLQSFEYTGYGDAARTAVLTEIAVGAHRDLYTKLFQN